MEDLFIIQEYNAVDICHEIANEYKAIINFVCAVELFWHLVSWSHSGIVCII